MLLVTDVINHMSALYDPEIEWEESAVQRVLDQKDLSVGARAESLLGSAYYKYNSYKGIE